MDDLIAFLIGGAVGIFISWWTGQTRQELLQAKESFFVNLFSMLGKLAKVDGVVTPLTIELIRDFMQNSLVLDEDSRKKAILIFNEAKDSSTSFEEYARRFYQASNKLIWDADKRRESLSNTVALLLRVSSVDQTYSANKENMMLAAVDIFGLKREWYEQLRTGYCPTFEDSTKYYQVLGCTPEDSIEDIKKKYRRLVQDYHPDKVLSKGLAPEFVTFANKKFQEIQYAYETIKKERAF